MFTAEDKTQILKRARQGENVKKEAFTAFEGVIGSMGWCTRTHTVSHMGISSYCCRVKMQALCY